MLGHRISDPDGIEGPAGTVEGLGLLDVETVLSARKTLSRVTGHADGAVVQGYEIHIGQTQGPDCTRPMLNIDTPGGGGRPDGAGSRDGLVAGCYVHGVFAADGYRRLFLAALGRTGAAPVNYEAEVERVLDSLASHLETHLNIDALFALAR
jgi:adenosylcobyric acid synthase